MSKVIIDAENLYYKDLNQLIREKVKDGVKEIELKNVYGQRYIGTNLYGLDTKDLKIKVYGTPGNDLGAFLNDIQIEVFGNVQDGCGNTMNSGRIIVHGNAGDIIGYGARGGKIFIKGSAGYRCAIHMKEFNDKKPVIVIGETMQDFFCEYMAGGVVLLLALNLDKIKIHRGSYFIGTGMHGGKIYLRGNIEKFRLGKEVDIAEIDPEDELIIKENVNEYSNYFSCNPDEILSKKFIKIYPKYLRPYGKLYTY